ncbi:hypothetical protein Riv7116_5685 [Rivularia sp. PCC 7116]|nr:hypothetical protein Riv7116_5685 [Rivularia sp. PCC 7116]
MKNLSFLRSLFWLRIIVVFLIAVIMAISWDCGSTFGKAPKRDKFLQPFLSTSIWNMPIGDNARYVKANIGKAKQAAADEEYFFELKDKYPYRRVYAPGAWGEGRCTGTKYMNIAIPIPDNLIIPDATKEPHHTPNNASAFLMPDGRTLVQLSPLARCQKKGSLYGWRYDNVDIYGEGIGGAHFGSGLSSIGGSIRKGELTNNKPIPHALKVVIWAKKYLHYDNKIRGYRWPASRADDYAAKEYGGKNHAFVQGSLLAIPPKITKKSLKLQTPAGKKLFDALQNYGAYVVEDSHEDTHYFAVEKGVPDEFRKKYGYDFETRGGKFYDDYMKLFQALHIVDNNSPNSIGGGGKSRVKLAPPIGN